jgi:hypothetical protein
MAATRPTGTMADIMAGTMAGITGLGEPPDGRH